MLQGEKRSIRNLEFSTTCCWTAIFETDEKDLGLILFYQTGLIEIRLSILLIVYFVMFVFISSNCNNQKVFASFSVEGYNYIKQLLYFVYVIY